MAEAKQPKQLKHYELLSRLGEGGMGVVYLARDTRLGRTVALKMLPTELARDEERSQRFEREARIVSHLSHPGIATLYDFDRDGDVAFLTMEYVEGPTLRELLAEGALPLDRLLDCAVQIADAIAAAHDRGVTHRDLKPENVIAAESGYYKVLDFGVARIDDQDAGGAANPTQTPTRTWSTKAGALIGTVAYMSPEQVMGQPADARSDLFSFGSVLYELATGQPAFRRNNEIATAHAIGYEEPTPIRELRPEIPEGFELVVRRCMAKEPGDRYRNIRELADDLKLLRNQSLSGSRQVSELNAGRTVATPSPGPRPVRVALFASGVVLAGLVTWLGWRAMTPQPVAVGPQAGVGVAAESTVATAPRGTPRVIVAFFENNSGDREADWISRGLPEMLTTDLSRSQGLEVIATQRLYDLLAMSEGASDEPSLDRSTTAELARWAGADVVISGSVFRAGERYRIDAQGYDTQTGRITVAHKVEGTELFRMVDELTEGLRRGLQLEDAPEGELEEVTTSSEVAYRLFLDGKVSYESLRFAEAADLLATAVEEDPDFSLAWLYLALTLSWTDDVDGALEILTELRDEIDGLPGIEGQLTQALAAFYLDRDFDTGNGLLEELVEEYPQYHDAWVWWGRGIFSVKGNPMQASRKLRRAIEEDPNNLLAIAAMADQLAALGDVDTASSILREAGERNPDAREAIEERVAAYPDPG